MIEKMKKVSIVILNKEKEDALKRLRKIGLVHLEKIEGSSEKLNAFKEYTNNAVVSESILGEIKLPKTKGPAATLSDEKVIQLCSDVVTKSDRKKQLLEEINADTTELDRFAQWGSVSIEDFEYLADDVTKTTFENGYAVYVNFDYSDFTTDSGMTIGARDYVVVKVED